MAELTKEQIELATHLESIFMPYGSRQRQEANRKQNGNPESQQGLRFAHYTSADAALKIIKQKRVWMRNATCMSDYREVQYGFTMLQKYFVDEAKRGAFVAALDACAPGAAMEAIKLFDQWYAGPNGIPLNTYIASVSEHESKEDQHGRLSMWRGFGGVNTVRVAIVFRTPWNTGALFALNTLFSPVAYLTEAEVFGVLDEVVRNIGVDRAFLSSIDPQRIIDIVFYMLLAGVTCLKHEGFGEELEWRVIYCPKFRPSPLIEVSTEVVAGVPQPIHWLPLDEKVSDDVALLDLTRMLDRVIIGASPYPWVIYEAFVSALRDIGMTKPEERVFVSGIPIRG